MAKIKIKGLEDDNLKEGLAKAYNIEHGFFDSLEKLLPSLIPPSPDVDFIVKLGGLVTWSQDRSKINIYSIDNAKGNYCKKLNEIEPKSMAVDRTELFEHNFDVSGADLCLISCKYKQTYGKYENTIYIFENIFDKINKVNTIGTVSYPIKKIVCDSNNIYVGINDNKKGKIARFDKKKKYDGKKLDEIIQNTPFLNGCLDDFFLLPSNQTIFVVAGQGKVSYYDSNFNEKVIFTPNKVINNIKIDNRRKILFGSSGDQVFAYCLKKKICKWVTSYDEEFATYSDDNVLELLLSQGVQTKDELKLVLLNDKLEVVNEYPYKPSVPLETYSGAIFNNNIAFICKEGEMRKIRILNEKMKFLCDIEVPDATFGAKYVFGGNQQ